MHKWPNLKFPPIKPRARKVGEQIEVWDDLRKCWLRLTPEEWVRRHLIGWLCRKGVEPLRVVQEYPVELNGQPQRADVVVVDNEGRPWLLVECKAAEVPLSTLTLDQLVRYNWVLKAPYLMITNGMEHACYCFDGAETRPMAGLPDFGELKTTE